MMFKSRAFRLPRRSRREQYICQMVWAYFREWVLVRFARDAIPFRVQANHLASERGQFTQETPLRKDDGCLCTLQNMGEAVLRICWIERHVGTAGLQNSQNSDHHFGGALRENRHQHLGTSAVFQQKMRDLVRPLVEFPISDPLVIGNQRY